MTVELIGVAVFVRWNGGELCIEPDGSITVSVHDPWFDGRIEQAEALQLAEAIRMRVRASELRR